MPDRNVRASRLIAALACGAAAPALSQAQPPAAPGPCAAPEHRQFDFWLGDWEVRTPEGKLAGHNTITRTLGGCVLQENWRGARGHRGTSYNIYDASRRRWHQTWVDDEGNLLQLDGAFADGRMVLTGESVDSTGKPVKQRITWEPLAGGKVRQVWDSSPDGIAGRSSSKASTAAWVHLRDAGVTPHSRVSFPPAGGKAGLHRRHRSRRQQTANERVADRG